MNKKMMRCQEKGGAGHIYTLDYFYLKNKKASAQGCVDCSTNKEGVKIKGQLDELGIRLIN
jgi:hypothetical protein